MAKAGPFTVASRRLAIRKSVFSDFNGLRRLLRAIVTTQESGEPARTSGLKEPAQRVSRRMIQSRRQQQRLARLLERPSRRGAGLGHEMVGSYFFTAIFLPWHQSPGRASLTGSFSRASRNF